MRFVKTLTIAHVIPSLDNRVITRAFSASGETLDEADTNCLNDTLNDNHDLAAISPYVWGNDLGLDHIKSVAELVTHINLHWPHCTASQYGFALKDA